jgi:hypothetical protein
MAPTELSTIFSALGQSTGLKSLKVYCLDSMDESLCTAIKNGLGMNETLEKLELSGFHVTDDDSDFCCTALSFLRTNKAIKSLKVDLTVGATHPRVSVFLRHITGMPQENASLEDMCIQICTPYQMKSEEFADFVTALQHNTTLKFFNFRGCGINCGDLVLTHDEDKQTAALLKKNYALEVLHNIEEARELQTILRLTAAGRRYLIEDGSSISKGVEVLIRVNNDTNCVFFHLLENPRLCDRRAVEMVTTD